MFAMRNSDNAGKIITCHDSDAEYMFVINSDGSYHSRIDLALDNWRDAEEITGYTKNGTNYIVLCEFGDNPANRGCQLTTSTLYLFKMNILVHRL